MNGEILSCRASLSKSGGLPAAVLDPRVHFRSLIAGPTAIPKAMPITMPMAMLSKNAPTATPIKTPMAISVASLLTGTFQRVRLSCSAVAEAASRMVGLNAAHPGREPI